MTLEDRYGNPVGTGSTKARDYYDEGVKLLLSSNFGALECMQSALTEDPEFALGHVGLARAHMTAANMPEARAAMARASDLADGLSDRERQHIAVHNLLAAGRGAETRALVERHIVDYPRDVLVAQICTSVFGLIAFSGCAATEPQMLAYSTALLPHYGDDWWIQNVHAVSLCENGMPDRALDLMERSLEQYPRNANGAHFKAHALYELGETDRGLDYLKGWIPDYDRRAVIHGHISWHVALWALAQGDVDTVWTTLDDAISPEACQGLPINIVTDTAALLYRAELAGLPVDPERWQNLSNYVAAKFPNPGQSFVDMHAALTHAMAGQTDLLDKYVSQPKGYAADLVAPVARAWQAVVRQDWTAALDDLTPVMAGTARFGGSRAQRDLLELTYLNLLLKTGKGDEARRLMQTRRAIFAKVAPVSGLGV